MAAVTKRRKEALKAEDAETEETSEEVVDITTFMERQLGWSQRRISHHDECDLDPNREDI